MTTAGRHCFQTSTARGYFVGLRTMTGGDPIVQRREQRQILRLGELECACSSVALCTSRCERPAACTTRA